MNNHASFEDLVKFIREEIGDFKLEINNSTLIENDLGVTGLDAVELIKLFGKTFGVDLTNFTYEKYFYPEPSVFIWKTTTILPLTVGDLYLGLINKKLDDQLILK